MADLITSSSFDNSLPAKYQTMLTQISEHFPLIEKATRHFNKSQSQFMNHTMTVSQPTEIRSMRQILAEIERRKQALNEAYFKWRKQKVRRKIKETALETETDPFKRELLEIEIEEINSKIASSMGYIEGAIRTVASYMAQFNNLLKKTGIEELTEEVFEKDEERYHIMTAFTQALIAARARGGVIDEGNHIYFHQIGINGTMAQKEISSYLANEGRNLSEGKSIKHSNVLSWLDEMAERYKGCAVEYTQARGMTLLDIGSCHNGNGNG